MNTGAPNAHRAVLRPIGADRVVARVRARTRAQRQLVLEAIARGTHLRISRAPITLADAAGIVDAFDAVDELVDELLARLTNGVLR